MIASAQNKNLRHAKGNSFASRATSTAVRYWKSDSRRLSRTQTGEQQETGPELSMPNWEATAG
jgi:hypothetical protein